MGSRKLFAAVVRRLLNKSIREVLVVADDTFPDIVRSEAVTGSREARNDESARSESFAVSNTVLSTLKVIPAIASTDTRSTAVSSML